MNWNIIKTTYLKEIRTLVRDRKTIMRIVLMPLLIPFVFVLYGFLYDSMNSTDYVIGINYEMNDMEKALIESYEDATFKNYSDIKALEDSYENGDIDGYIVKNDNNYSIYADDSSTSGIMVQSMAESYLNGYNEMLGYQTLGEYGIDYNEVYHHINIENVSLNEDNTDMITSMTFSVVMAYIMMIICLVCVMFVTDATAGEKERGTLETILTFPIKSSELVIGKYLAASSAAFVIGLCSYLLSIPSVLISREAFDAYKNASFTTKPAYVLLCVFVILLASLVTSGVCMALAGKSKTYKEAQSSLSFVSILPMIPMVLSLGEKNISLLNWIPIANCTAALNDIVVNKADAKSLVIIFASTIIYIVAIVIYISKQYSSEKTLFS